MGKICVLDITKPSLMPDSDMVWQSPSDMISELIDRIKPKHINDYSEIKITKIKMFFSDSVS